MPYMLLIHEPVGQRQTRTPAEGEAVYERMLRFADELKARGVLRAVESLASQDDRAARVKVRDGRAAGAGRPVRRGQGNGRRLLPAGLRQRARRRWPSPRECPAAEWATVEVRARRPLLYVARYVTGGLSIPRRRCFVV